MASSLVGGLIADGTPPERISIADPDDDKRAHAARHFGIHTTADNSTLVAGCDVVVLAVKPQLMRPVCEAVARPVGERAPLVISVAAGVRVADMERWLGGKPAIVRTMPNTPAMVQCGATALYANDQAGARERELAEAIMRAVGLTLWVDDEALMDVVTAVSGSGPAYFFLMMEMLEEAGTQLGLARDQARLLALQTAFGASKMALESDEPTARLRERVTSPGGTTERAIGVMQQADIRAVFERAVTAARDRSRELADLLGKQ